MTPDSALRADVLVIGTGLAGHAAALSASASGASVLLIEKGEDFGGTSVVAGGGFAFAGTDHQRALGVVDNVHAYRQTLLEASEGKADVALVDAFLAEQLATYHWLVSYGVEFSLFRSGGADIDRVHTTEQGAVVRALHEIARADPNIRYLAATPALRLLRANGGGRVTGATILYKGAPLMCLANRGVVLATGGFNRSTTLLETYAPQWSDAVKLGGVHNEGDGLRMAGLLGAGHADMGYVQASFGGTLNAYPQPETGGDPPMLLLPFTAGAIIVNTEGRRFVNEGFNYKQISRVLRDQPGRIAFQLFDAKLMARSRSDVSVMDLKRAYERGIVREGASVADLAARIAVPADVLEQTIRRYNAAAVPGATEPEHGRRIASFGDIDPRIDTPPFYAVATGNALTTTYCGVKVGPDTNVVTVFGEPIPALFAAGEVVGGFHGAGYYSGSALAKSAVFGRIAGRQAART